MKYGSLNLKSDYSLLRSLIKIDDLIKFAKENDINVLSLCDDNLCGSLEFYNACKKNNIKCIIGLEYNYENEKNYKCCCGDFTCCVCKHYAKHCKCGGFHRDNGEL